MRYLRIALILHRAWSKSAVRCDWIFETYGSVVEHINYAIYITEKETWVRSQLSVFFPCDITSFPESAVHVSEELRCMSNRLELYSKRFVERASIDWRWPNVGDAMSRQWRKLTTSSFHRLRRLLFPFEWWKRQAANSSCCRDTHLTFISIQHYRQLQLLRSTKECKEPLRQCLSPSADTVDYYRSKTLRGMKQGSLTHTAIWSLARFGARFPKTNTQHHRWNSLFSLTKRVSLPKSYISFSRICLFLCRIRCAGVSCFASKLDRVLLLEGHLLC